MDKFTKIVLEQIRKGEFGTRPADASLTAKFKKFTPDEKVTSFYFVDKHGRGKKYPPLTADQIIDTYIAKLPDTSQYQNKDYIFILDTKSQKTGKKESLWDVFVIRKNAAFPNVDNKRIDSVRLGNAGQAPILSLKAFQNLKTTIASEIAAAEKARIEKEKEEAAEKARIEKEKLEAQQNITKKALSGNINVNNLGGGTTDAKAFQELLYLIGKSLASDTTEFKNFAKYRNERNGQPGWKGNIGEQSLALLDRLNLKETWEKGDAGKTSVIKELHDALPNTNESINYFKGINMNIKLKDLINEQLRVKSDDEMKVPVIPNKPASSSVSSKSSTNVVKKQEPKKINTNNIDINSSEWTDHIIPMIGKAGEDSVLYKNFFNNKPVNFSEEYKDESKKQYNLPADVYRNLTYKQQQTVTDKIDGYKIKETKDMSNTLQKYNSTAYNILKKQGWKDSTSKRDRVQLLYKGNHVINLAKMTIGYGGVPSIGAYSGAKGVGRLKLKWKVKTRVNGEVIDGSKSLGYDNLYVRYDNRDYLFKKFASWTWN